MNNFKILYRILRSLEESMDAEQYDRRKLDPELLGISKNRRDALLKMLSDNGYITGVTYITGMHGVKIDNIEITLKGLEYLEDNTMLKKAARAMRDIKDIKPF